MVLISCGFCLVSGLPGLRLLLCLRFAFVLGFDVFHQCAEHLIHIDLRNRRDGEGPETIFGLEGIEALGDVFLGEGIGFGQRDDFVLLGKTFIIGLQLTTDYAVGIEIVFLRRVDQMQQDAAALDMPKEAVTDADAFMGAFDEARISAMTNSRVSMPTTPRLGCRVVKG